MIVESALDIAVVAFGYVFLCATSGMMLKIILETAGGDGSEDPPAPDSTERDVGRIIGKAENVLVLSFVLVGAYTALSLIFAAKSIVRREDMASNSLYYLAGTLVNFTYSLAVGLAVRLLLAIL